MIALEAAMRRIAAVLMLFVGVTATNAHYNMLLPSKPSVQKGEKVTFTYQFGHPFEHELFDAPKPVSLAVLGPKIPGREALDVAKTLRKIEVAGAEGKKVVAWQFDYTPAERGDYVFMLKTPPQKHDEQGHVVEDLVKVVLHVQTQNGWDAVDPDSKIDLAPYTRPYGLLPGMVFKGRAGAFPYKKNDVFPRDIHPDSGLRVEVERYNAKPLKELPPDELITFQTKTDFDGFFVTTLPDPGWWGITAVGTREANTMRRVTLWVHVDEKK
jgi:cobalt/nickel transport protein